MTTSLLMSKIIDLTDARRRRAVRSSQVSEHEQRREYRRISSERLFIQIVECPDPDMVGTTLSCRAVDASSSGLRIWTDEYIPMGAHLDLWVDNLSRPGKYFLTSDVRWIRRADGAFEFGVELHEGAATDIDEWRKSFA